MGVSSDNDECPKSPTGLSIEIVEGMEFPDLEKAHATYSDFSYCRGFGVRKRSSKRGYCKFVCCNEGKGNTKHVGSETEVEKSTRKGTSTVRTGCTASLHVVFDKLRQQWVVSKFSNIHNHQLVTPRSVPFIRSHRSLPEIAGVLSERFVERGLPASKVVHVLDDDVPYFDKRDCWNHVQKLRLSNLDVGDAQAVLNYCMRKRDEDEQFFYAIQCDDQSRMVNFFWVDGRSRMYYTRFGDVVTFDTTYKTNKYSMPFAPFTGINHHMRSMLFGCALLQDESESTFVWLFEKWLEAMNGKMPQSIITDQDLAMANAIAKVFPTTTHRLCLWHILKKFPEKLASIYHKKSSFKKALKSCIRESHSTSEFEESWTRIMMEYGLLENDWLQGLYNKRDMWVPVFNREYFFAGMNTTQRSESINSFFDHFVDSRTNLRSFVLKFDYAIQQIWDREKKEDYDSRHKQRVLYLRCYLEEHASEVYTCRVFGKVRDELEKINKFTKEKIKKMGTKTTYKVVNGVDSRDSAIVVFDTEDNTSHCSCNLYAFMGILCRHIFAIFQKKDVHKIPLQYILPRWTKTANVGIEFVYLKQNLRNDDIPKLLSLQRRFSGLLDNARQSDDTFRYILHSLDELQAASALLNVQPSEVEVPDACCIDDELHELTRP